MTVVLVTGEPLTGVPLAQLATSSRPVRATACVNTVVHLRLFDAAAIDAVVAFLAPQPLVRSRSRSRVRRTWQVQRCDTL